MAECSDVSTSDDGSSENPSYTQEGELSSGDRNSISILPDDLLLKYVCAVLHNRCGGGPHAVCWDSVAVVYGV